uniref:Uncharacterized protein n=1 Tax=Pyrodinium bahamense TaxID=73915 RepID=A0A7R9ZXA6_9DINO|mmetsp:Transcript_13546/g.37584  ORF Transcript_13546/g.37584 Transcript_13546/m.37584 type:complete len:458 (-) Transcript_13546:130-1503(-)
MAGVVPLRMVTAAVAAGVWLGTASCVPDCRDELCLMQSLIQLQLTDGRSALDALHLRTAPQAESSAKHDDNVVDGFLPGFRNMLQTTLDALNLTSVQDFDPFRARGPDPSVLGGDDRVEYIWKHDIFPGKGHTWRHDGDEGLNFFKAAPVQDWIILALACAILCLIDVAVLQRFPDTFKVHLAAIVFWVVVAVFFNLIVWHRMGKQKSIEWISGYVLEWMLSMDNLFVFHLIFKTYKTPSNQIHKAVFVGVIGAVVMRLIFFMVVSTLLRLARWVRFPFGLLLIWSGIQAAKDDGEQVDVKDTLLISGLRRCLGSRFTGRYDEEGHSMFIWSSQEGLQVTLLLMVIFCLEATDILFALDSVSAKVAQIPDQYIAFSSSVIAMYGLRAMFFVVQDLVEAFDLLQYGLCLILVFIGLELMFARYLHLASSTVCIMIISVFVICIIGSQVKQKISKQSCI